MRRIPVLTSLFFIAMTLPALAARPITIDDLLAVKTVSDPQISPDGKRVVYVVSEIDREANKSNSSLWGLPLVGGTPRRLTTSPGANNHPRWSPDGKNIAFLSSRSGSPQIWLLPADGGEAHQLTKLPIDVDGPLWSPQGDKIAFNAQVYPGKSPEETAAKDKAKEASQSKARVYDKLMIRHWTSWDEGKRSHLFVADSRTGASKDLTPGLDAHTPPGPFGGSNDYAWSADGKSIALTVEPLKNQAWSTNTDIWMLSIDGGKLENLTESNKGGDAQPSFSPAGDLLAYVSQARSGFEADHWVLSIRDLKSGENATFPKLIDRPIQSFVWEHDARDHPDRSRTLFAVIDSKGTEPIVRISVHKEPAGKFVADLEPEPVVSGGINTSVQVTPIAKGRPLIYVHSSAAKPGEIYKSDTADRSEPVALTHHNEKLIEGLDVSKAEGFSFQGADGDEVSGWLIKPPGFDPKKKYAVVFLIHGGPQGAWHDEWHARWNYQMFASPGFAVVAINPRGSTGYGQKFTDQISQDWTGKVYDDLMKGLDFALKTYPFLDGNKVGAAGGSYGGFMVNWIAGHTDRFKALISHAGVFDLTSKYGTTEELWFPEWEFGGPPWEKADHYREHSPSGFVANFKTPTLVTHGALDFRVPDAQGLGMFTSLQRRGVPSRYVFFPDEGHWILKPANRVVWWSEMLGWLKTYLK